MRRSKRFALLGVLTIAAGTAAACDSNTAPPIDWAVGKWDLVALDGHQLPDTLQVFDCIQLPVVVDSGSAEFGSGMFFIRWHGQLPGVPGDDRSCWSAAKEYSVEQDRLVLSEMTGLTKDPNPLIVPVTRETGLRFNYMIDGRVATFRKR
jgi:hypothetical protein